MIRFKSVVSVCHTRSARRARSTPTTAIIGPSVYMCAKYRRCCAPSGFGSSRRRMRARDARQDRIASLKRCAMLDAGWVPKPSLRSDTKKSALPFASACLGGVLRISDS
eukprot:731213-Pleurochrysis_carterae.AAC.1